MARISGVDLPRNKRIEIGLTYVFGIGNTSANQIVKTACRHFGIYTVGAHGGTLVALSLSLSLSL